MRVPFAPIRQVSDHLDVRMHLDSTSDVYHAHMASRSSHSHMATDLLRLPLFLLFEK